MSLSLSQDHNGPNRGTRHTFQHCTAFGVRPITFAGLCRWNLQWFKRDLTVNKTFDRPDTCILYDVPEREPNADRSANRQHRAPIGTGHVTGRFIAVVGPSGVGKDSLMDLAAARAGMVRARRVITRAPQAGGEAFDAVTETEFSRRRSNGDFALHWAAHGLNYAIPAKIDTILAQGHTVLANLSRAVLPQMADRFPKHRIILLTAHPDVLAHRLATRGRESERDIARRLKRAVFQVDQSLNPVIVENNGTLDVALKKFLAACQPDKG